MKSYEELLAENEALTAQVGRMAAFIKLSAKKWEGVSEVEPTFWNLLRVANEAPQQCLAEIKAEAGRAGFIACAEWVGDSEYENDKMLKAADEYAAKIRNTGTWLRDSNVNGGKRQGVAE